MAYVQKPNLNLISNAVQVADPDGYFKAGSRAAEAAKAKAQKAMQLEKQQKEAQARRQKEQLVSLSCTHSQKGLTWMNGKQDQAVGSAWLCCSQCQRERIMYGLS